MSMLLGGSVKRRALTISIAIALFTMLAIPGQIAAQDKTKGHRQPCIALVFEQPIPVSSAWHHVNSRHPRLPNEYLAGRYLQKTSSSGSIDRNRTTAGEPGEPRSASILGMVGPSGRF